MRIHLLIARLSEDDMGIAVSAFRTLDEAISAGNQMAADDDLILDDEDSCLPTGLEFVTVTDPNVRLFCEAMWNGRQTGYTYMWVQPDSLA